MVTPVTGPFSRTDNTLSLNNPFGYGRVNDVSQTRTWKRQRRPYTLPLDFTFQRSQVLSRVYHPDAISAWWGSTEDDASYPAHVPASTYPAIYNKAYAKFVNKLKPDEAGMLVNLAQRKQAIEMIAMRAGQIATFARRLRKGQLGMAASAIGLRSIPPGWKKKGKSFGDLFLEGHFGWEPLVKDISAAVELLQSGVPPSRVTAAHLGTGSGSTSTPTSSDPVTKTTWKDKVVWRIQAEVLVSNPNLFLANQLGFVNAGTVAWDVVPFSFVLDWFVNVGQFLAAFTDFWGLTISNSQTALLWIRETTKWQVNNTWPGHPPGTVYRTYRFKRASATRRVGAIPGPTLAIRAPWVLSPVRGLTSISLLLQQLRGK